MSQVQPQCRVCLDPRYGLINKRLRENVSPRAISGWLATQYEWDKTHGKSYSKLVTPTYSMEVIRRHRLLCLGVVSTAGAASNLPGVRTRAEEHLRLMAEAEAEHAEGGPSYIAPTDVPTPEDIKTTAPGPEFVPPPADVLDDPEKRIGHLRAALYGNLGAYQPKDVLALYMQELKTEEARANAASKGKTERPDEDDGGADLEAALAQAVGHAPRRRGGLRVVRA